MTLRAEEEEEEEEVCSPLLLREHSVSLSVCLNSLHNLKTADQSRPESI